MLNHHDHHHDHHHYDHDHDHHHNHKQQQPQEEELLQLMPLHHNHHHHHHHHQINTPNPNDDANPQSTGNLLLISPNHFNSPAAISSCPTHDFMVYNHNHNHDDDDDDDDDDYNIIAHDDTTMIGESSHLIAATKSSIMNNEVRPSSISGCSSSGGDEENHAMNQARSSHHDHSSAAATNGKRLAKSSSTLRYIKYSAEQVEALEVLYHHCPKPSSATRQQLIHDNPLLRHIHPQQIKVWFQNRRCREKQRRETTRLQSVNGKLIAMNKLLMEENERLQKQVSQLMHEKDHLLQHLHYNHIPLAPSPLNLPPPAHLNPNRNIINHNYTNTTTDNHGSFNLSPCYV